MKTPKAPLPPRTIATIVREMKKIEARMTRKRKEIKLLHCAMAIGKINASLAMHNAALTRLSLEALLLATEQRKSHCTCP